MTVKIFYIIRVLPLNFKNYLKFYYNDLSFYISLGCGTKQES